MTLDSCVPVKVALQLMDTSSLGRAYQYDSYRQTHNQLQHALQSIVNGMYPLPKLPPIASRTGAEGGGERKH